MKRNYLFDFLGNAVNDGLYFMNNKFEIMGTD